MHNRKRKQLLVILGLSFLVFACLLWEADKKNLFPDADSTKQEKKAEQETEDISEGETKTLTEETQVRVLLMDTDFESLFHNKIKVTSKKSFSVTVNGKTKKYSAGQVVTYSAKNKKLKEKEIIFEPEQGAKLQVLSITRQNISPSYRGTLQVIWKKSGLLLKNELPLEQYLYAVIPSELSTSNKMEALKAQAVCARSYAYNQIQSERYKQYDADLDDSVACQVYNNVAEDKRSRKAVKATKGKVLTSNGKVVQTYYYSTSWGYAASGQDVWATKSAVSYLTEKLQITDEAEKNTGKLQLDLSSEKQFQKFIEEEVCETYDSSADWYRWRVTISKKDLSNRIDSLLASCYQSDSSTVLTQQSDGTYKKKKLKTLGKLKKIRIEKRVKSGLVTEIVLVGSKNVVKVCTQYAIRKVLAPVYEQISYAGGKSHTAMSMLPSAAFYILETSQKGKSAFCFVGGGFGHGTGMSQCGAAEMARRGKSYTEILQYYFEGTEVTAMSELR